MRDSPYDAIIVGGGPAGSAAAIQLAADGYRILVIERKEYPEHKVCGEFLSPEVATQLKKLGFAGRLEQAGARTISRALISSRGGNIFHTELPGPGLGISRYSLDGLLADRADEAGATVLPGTTARNIRGCLKDGFTVSTDDGSYHARIILGAWGKRGLLDRKLDRRFFGIPAPVVGFKAHYSGTAIPGTVELHSFDGGYCGIVEVEQGLLNICWITTDRILHQAGGSAEAMLEHRLKQNPALSDRLESVRQVSDSFRAAGQISFSVKDRFEGDVCMLGDTAAMIAPLCGDGMAMALRSAEIAADSARRYFCGEISGQGFRQRYELTWRNEFRTRIRLGRIAHSVYGRPVFAGMAVAGFRFLPALGNWVIRQTRG